MRALLVSGPRVVGQPPTGLLMLATLARQQGWQVELVELPTSHSLGGFLASVRRADLVGFTTVCSTYPRVLVTAGLIRSIAPGLPIVLGGPQATIAARRTVEGFPSIDLVVRGEAEAAWPGLLREVSRGSRDWSAVPGAVWSQDGRAREVPAADIVHDLDSLPMPAFDLDPESGRDGRMAVEVGRGCPYGCTFCSTNSFFKRRFRMKSVGRILQDIAEMRRGFGASHFDFIHDMFTVRQDTVEEICAGLRGSGVTWNCSARTDRLSEDLLDRMIAAGCTGIYVGIETGSQRLQRETRKNLTVGDAVKMIRLCQAKGLHITASMIFGYPQETVADLRDTLLCYLELMTPHPSRHARGQVTPQMHLFAPLAETPILGAARGFAFDGRLSSTVRVDYADGLWPEERRLIAADFELFSAFYHPTGTPYGRANYLALDALLEVLPHNVEVGRWLAGERRLDFASYILEGGFDAEPSATVERRGAAMIENFLRPTGSAHRTARSVVPVGTMR